MKELLDLVEQKKRVFAQLPLFDFMQDSSLTPQQRLSFAPCLTPFAMSFGELNKYVFRDETSDDPVQAIINRHTYEDDHHWVWLLEDIEKLGLNRSLKLNDSLRFLWGEETNLSRKVAYELYRHTFQAHPIKKLFVIEAAEATGNAFLEVSAKIAAELSSVTQQDYRFFGERHLIVDTGHTYSTPKTRRFLETIELTEAQNREYSQVIASVFEAFTEFMDELLIYAKKHMHDQPYGNKVVKNQEKLALSA